MTVAIFAVLCVVGHADRPRQRKPAWEAPALDPALLVALFLIYLELLVVTAIAIVFSTYSSAILSAAFTFGLVIAGHFSQDLRNFDQVTDAPASAGGGARPLLRPSQPVVLRREVARRARGSGAAWEVGLAWGTPRSTSARC